MGRTWRWVLVVTAVACSGAPSSTTGRPSPSIPTSPSASTGPSPSASTSPGPSPSPSQPPGGPVERPPLAPEDLAFVAALEPFLAKVTRSSARCHKLFDPITPEAVRSSGLPFDDAGLTAACGEVGALYDTSLAQAANHDRSTDVLLTHLARIADDLDYTRRTFDESLDEQVNSRKHVHDALAAVDAAVIEWRASVAMSYERGAAQPDPEMWRRDIGNDGNGLPTLRMLYGQLAFNQGYDKVNVRRRMLESFLRTARRPLEARLGAVSDVKDPDERARRQSYLDACTRYLDVYTAVLAAFADGEVRDENAHAARVADADRALAEWKQVWEREQARVGGTGG